VPLQLSWIEPVRVPAQTSQIETAFILAANGPIVDAAIGFIINSLRLHCLHVHPIRKRRVLIKRLWTYILRI
jgi:hypothetical protein